MMAKHLIQSVIIFLSIFSFISWESIQKQSSSEFSKSTYQSIQKIEIKGIVQPEEQYTYRLEPFMIPDGIGAIQVEFEYSGRNNFSEIEIGLFDPNRFRGTSRFSKQSFYVGKFSATASYFPGPIIRGKWNISLGFPTIQKQSEYKVTIHLIPDTHSKFMGPSEVALNENSQWYSGDFHTHTGHSDGFGCLDMEGNRVPCQVYQVVEAAQENKLDFLSITDHNTVSHHQDMTVIQPIFSKLLLIRGQEVTTFYGHANVYGTSLPIDFRIGFEGRTFEHIQDDVNKTGGLLSINHPGRVTGANCTGCGWNAKNTDYGRIKAIEIVNGTNVENDIAGIPFWHDLLNKGYKITGIGGSDDHSAGFGKSHPGIPTTMVYANSLSEEEILEGVKKGTVYLKTKGPGGPDISFNVMSKNRKWTMGETIDLDLVGDQNLELEIQYKHSSKQIVELIYNGEILISNIQDVQEDNNSYTFTYDLKNLKEGWLRFNLRDYVDKEISIISNPIYMK